ncbi:MAG TPA: hypothetical protein VGQ90_01210 [Stellaceae bacterium]|jgi:hypothetical protein|nr:hypothetical protein [Stellaceae bacterium]
MSIFAKSAVLSLGLLAGIATVANAQSTSIAALPPGAAAAPPSAVQPSGVYPGPRPGSGWYPRNEQQTQSVQSSPTYVGPKPGEGWYPRSEQQSQTVQPSPQYVGPKPN